MRASIVRFQLWNRLLLYECDPAFADRVSDGLPEIVPGWEEPEFR